MNLPNQTLTASYKKLVTPWVISRLEDNQWIELHRYRSRSDAEGHLQLLRRSVPTVQFNVTFDPHTQIVLPR